MKVCISSLGTEGKDLLDKRFGRCDYFQIYDTESKELVAFENEGKTARGGAGIAAAQQLLEKKVEVVITGNLGPNAFMILEKAKIKTYCCGLGTVNEAIEKFMNNQLEALTQAGPSHQGM